MRKSPSSRPKRYQLRRAYSLLEVLLALALSVIVFSAIAMAIRLHMVSLTKQQVIIERKQIARSVLSMLANDLRSGIQYKAADYSGLENLIGTQQLMANAAIFTGENVEEDELTEDDLPTSDATESDEAAEGEEDPEIIVEEEVTFRPTMLGSESVVMIDISRLPRVDQYNPLIASADALLQSPSDVKSIAYFVSDASGGAEQEIEFDEGAPGGLYRREVDRAVAAYVGDFSLVDEPDPLSKLIAPEIAQLSFRYFDGSDWQTEWDSAELGGFPMAIEIMVVIDPARTSEDNKTYHYHGFDQETMETYRSVVNLPVAEPVPEEE